MKNLVKENVEVLDTINEVSTETAKVLTIDELKAKIKALQEASKLEALVLKEKQKELRAQALELKAAAKESAEELKRQEARSKAIRIKEILENQNFETKVNKSQVIRELMFKGYTKDMIVEETGYSNKFVLDNVWRIEKSLGLR